MARGEGWLQAFAVDEGAACGDWEEMEVEIERAVEQVEKDIDEGKERRRKEEVERSVGEKEGGEKKD